MLLWPWKMPGFQWHWMSYQNRQYIPSFLRKPLSCFPRSNSSWHKCVMLECRFVWHILALRSYVLEREINSFLPSQTLMIVFDMQKTCDTEFWWIDILLINWSSRIRHSSSRFEEWTSVPNVRLSILMLEYLLKEMWVWVNVMWRCGNSVVSKYPGHSILVWVKRLNIHVRI